MVRNLACIVLLSVMAAVALSACGSTANESDELGPPRFSAELNRADSIVATTAGLELVALATGDAPAFSLVGADTTGAKALYGRVAYDPASFHFIGGEQVRGVATDDRLLLCIDQPDLGFVEVGWVLTDFANRPGLTGDIDLCTLSFAAGAATPSRRVSTAPTTGAYNQVTISGQVNDDDQPVLTWPDTCGGDGSNDGFVTVADLTPIGQFFNQQSTAGPAQAKADYDKNGLVVVTDLAVIGAQFNVALGGYAILAGPDAGSLTELVRVDRSAMFAAPKAADGPLTWQWVGEALTEDTTYQVQPYDNTGTLGPVSINTVSLVAPDPTVTISAIHDINVPSGVLLDGDGNYVVLISELSVDDVIGNTEDASKFPEFLQLTATVSSLEDPGTQFETSTGVVWFIETGSGLGYVGNGENTDERNTKGRLSFINRGAVTVSAHVPGDFAKVQSVTFVLLSIDSIALVADQTNVAAGAPVQFTATGTFDWDNLINGNEETLDITNWCNWGSNCTPSTATYSIDTFTGTLDTTGASGAAINVTCEFPREENVTIHDNARRTSNMLGITVT